MRTSPRRKESKLLRDIVYRPDEGGVRMRNRVVLAVAVILLFTGCNSSVPADKPAANPEAPRSTIPAGAPREGAVPEAPAGPAVVENESAESTPPAPEPTNVTTEADIRKKTKKLLDELGEGYIAGIEGPFIVLGNIPEERFRQIIRYTIRACSDRMYQQYFTKKPKYTIRVYLFGDDTSYRQTAKRLWNDTGLSPFGYYKPSERALVMNIATGTGTLVHEMFHALVEPDFPDIPTWFNEGVASLYECCQVKSDKLIGLMNWRFPRLKRALSENKLVPLADLVVTTTRQFYGRGSDLHYSEARYFCMYLQKEGLLEKFYKKFRDNYEKDTTGRKFLEELLGKKIDAIEKDWLKWVKTLKYER